jgi:HSP20 family molecular chaperone IbpA
MLAVLIVPFPTALLAEYPYERVSAVLYTSVVAANALLFMLIWVHVRRREGLLRPGIPAVVIRLIGLQYRIAVITYLVLVVVSFVSVHVSIAGNILLAVFFALPLNAIKRREPLDRPIRRMVRRLPLNLSEDSVGTKRKIDEKDNGSRTLQSAQEQEPSSQTSQPKPMRNERSATAFPVPFALIRSLYDFANLTMGGLPRVDVTKRDEYFLVQIDLPGYRLEDVHVRIEDDKVVLEGERRSELRPTDGNAAERAYGRFRREIQLPANVDLETARATFETGVLEIAVRLPKEAKPRGGKIEIEINAAGKSTKSTTSG